MTPSTVVTSVVVVAVVFRRVTRPPQAREGLWSWGGEAVEGVGAPASARRGLGMGLGVAMLPELGRMWSARVGAWNPVSSEH